MKLIVGFGNPEAKFDGTRHNTGFFAISEYAKQKGIELRAKDKFKSLIGEMSRDGEKIILALPLTYYNLSGEAVRAIADFYQIEARDILIVHDELALPFGTLRTRWGGSPAGNNGIKSVNAHMGPGTARLRIGVYNDRRDLMDDADFVLSKFSKEETEQLGDITKKAIDIIDSFIANNFEITTH